MPHPCRAPAAARRRLLASSAAASLALAGAASIASAAPGTTVAPGHPAAGCAGEADAAARLACYDRHFGAPAAAPEAAPAAAERPLAPPLQSRSVPPVLPAGPAGPQPDALPLAAAPAGLRLRSASPLSRAWELAPEDQRGTFAVRTYRPNYLLPLHYTSSLRVPSSPTRPAPSDAPALRRVEAKFQVSLRTKALQDVGLPGADLWLAYSQISVWQIWNPAESSPFRSSDYEPEAIYVVPVGGRSGLRLPGDWRWRLAQLGVAHQSNGQGGALSRSWNRVWLGAAAERGPFILQLRAQQRVRFTASEDDNPDLQRYIGHAELRASHVGEGAATTLTWRTGSGFLRRGSLQLDWSLPVRRAEPDGLRWYVQVFTGYGETLLDYNHRQTSIGAGLALFRF